MSLELLAIDLGKRSFHLYGIDTDGVILSQKVSRAKLAEVVGDLGPRAIAMEACASAHYWARCWLSAGREVRLINPRFVKPFVKGSKNDAVDAEAIFEAAMRPTMRFVPVKSTDQQDLQSLHRARDRLICQRTALINHTRGLLAEYGVVLPQGPWRFMAQAPTAIAGADLSDLARAIFGELMDQLDGLDRRIKKLDAMIVTLCRTNETCRRLAKLPGVRADHRHCDRRQRQRWPSVSFGPRDGSLDRAGAQAVYNWRQATTRRHRTTCQPLSQAPDDPRRTRYRQPVGQA